MEEDKPIDDTMESVDELILTANATTKHMIIGQSRSIEWTPGIIAKKKSHLKKAFFFYRAPYGGPYGGPYGAPYGKYESIN